jgi:glycine/serine hydroxymethyltransferase
MDLAAGGHLTHGSPANQSGKWFKPVSYTVRQQDQLIDYDNGRRGGRAREAQADHRRRQRL